MKVVFANSAFISVPERFVVRAGRWARIRLKVRYGLLDHPQYGPVLIDAGYGPRVTTARNRSAALKTYSSLLSPRLVETGQPEALLAHHGYDCSDVEFVIITHFHADHVSHLREFPKARFIADSRAWRAIKRRSHLHNVTHGVFVELLPPDFEDRLICSANADMVAAPLSLPRGGDLFGDGSALAIDLPGHADGQFGVCFAHLATPLFYAADTQWHNTALLDDRPPGPPASLIVHDARACASSNEKVRRFEAGGGDIILCHDPSDSPFDFQRGAPQ